MRAHQLDKDGLIINTIEVNSLDVFPDLVDASIGGTIGDSVINMTLVKKPITDTFIEDRAAFIKKVDADVDAIYAAAIGNRATEYELAEKEALAYKAAAYAGKAPASISAWSGAKKESDKWATDNIIATSASWRAAQSAMRSQRLSSKEAAKGAIDLAALAAIRSTWDSFVISIRAQLGI